MRAVVSQVSWARSPSPSMAMVDQVRVAAATPRAVWMPMRRETATEVEVMTTQTGPGLRQASRNTHAIPPRVPR